VPSFDFEMGGVAVWKWAVLAGALATSLPTARLATRLIGRALCRIARGTSAEWDDRAVAAASGPTTLLVALLAIRAVALALIPPEALDGAWSLWQAAFICVIAWYAMRGVDLAAALAEERAVNQTVEEAFRRRQFVTQVAMVHRVAHVGIAALTVGLVLMQFDGVRSVGVSLLASAGIAGIVLGFAAQKSLGSLLAGIQLSIAQPIRIDDQIIVEGEFGTVEEITLTYVVVRVWDERRLIVPISRFLEQTFQNWTRRSPQLLGPVMLYADFGLPVDVLRAEQERFLRGHPLWDRRVQALQVSEFRDRYLELRALVSARNASELWDLRCALREHLQSFLAGLENGRFLPRFRLEGDLGEKPLLNREWKISSQARGRT